MSRGDRRIEKEDQCVGSCFLSDGRFISKDERYLKFDCDSSLTRLNTGKTLRD